MSDEKKLETRLDFELAVKEGMRNWEGLNVVESEIGLLLPEKIRVREKSGGLKEQPVRLACPTNAQRIKARTRARARASNLGLDPARDGQDKDLVEELERAEELAFAIREPDGDPSQMYPDGEALMAALANYRVIQQLYQLLDIWVVMNDPRYGEFDGEKLWRVLSEVVRRGDLSPLALIGGVDQQSCMMLSARAALSSPMAPSSVRLPWTSRSDEGTWSRA